MNEKYVLSRRAASNLAQIWRHLRSEAREAVADRVVAEIRTRLEFLSDHPGIGHVREDLSTKAVKFFPVHSWMIVYRPSTKPIQIVSILHGKRDFAAILKRIN